MLAQWFDVVFGRMHAQLKHAHRGVDDGVVHFEKGKYAGAGGVVEDEGTVGITLQHPRHVQEVVHLIHPSGYPLRDGHTLGGP